MMKKCTFCGTIKPMDMYHKARSRKDGHISHCKECERERWLKWYAKNSQRVIDNVRWWLNNSESYKKKCRASGKRWSLQNPKRRSESGRKWREANKDQMAALKRDWRTKNPMKDAEYNHARRTRKLANGGEVTASELSQLRADNPICAICRSKNGLEIDHIIPLALGGRNDISNLQILCAPCNRSKGIMPRPRFVASANVLEKLRSPEG